LCGNKYKYYTTYLDTTERIMLYFMLGLMCGALLALLYIDGDNRPPRF